VKEAGNESDASSEESQSDSKSGSESGYSSDSEAELKPKKRKRNVVEDDKVDASSEEPKTDAAPEDQELTDIKIDETVVKQEGNTDAPSAPIHKDETALPGKKFAKDLRPLQYSSKLTQKGYAIDLSRVKIFEHDDENNGYRNWICHSRYE
jgi:hypothetical protein